LLNERGEAMKEAADSSRNLGKEEGLLEGQVDRVGNAAQRSADKILATADKTKSVA
jgi:hypothetical protein